MKMSLDENEKILEMLSGLFQFNESEQFTQAAIAVTDDELVFYDDNAPDEKQTIRYVYHIKKRISLENVLLVLDEKIKKNKFLKNMGRLNFIVEEEDEDGDIEPTEVLFYYYLNDRRAAETFLDELKKLKIKTKKRKIDLNYPNL